MAQSDSIPVLYSFRRCPYAMRARLALFATNSLVALREVVLADKPAPMLAASPKGTVPVLIESDGTVLEESLDIMLWALRRSDHGGWLPKDESLLNEILALIADNDGPFKDSLDRYKYANRYPGAEPCDHRAAAMVFLQGLDARLAQNTYLFGDDFGLADAAIAPFVRQFANVDRAWFAAQKLPHLQTWLQAFLLRDDFLAIMGKYRQWHAGDAVVYFPEKA